MWILKLCISVFYSLCLPCFLFWTSQFLVHLIAYAYALCMYFLKISTEHSEFRLYYSFYRCWRAIWSATMPLTRLYLCSMEFLLSLVGVLLPASRTNRFLGTRVSNLGWGHCCAADPTSVNVWFRFYQWSLLLIARNRKWKFVNWASDLAVWMELSWWKDLWLISPQSPRCISSVVSKSSAPSECMVPAGLWESSKLFKFQFGKWKVFNFDYIPWWLYILGQIHWANCVATFSDDQLIPCGAIWQ